MKIIALALALALSLSSPARADDNFAPCMSWLAPKPRLVLLCIHGLGLDSKAYGNFAREMLKYDVSTYAIDVRGFGSWMRAAGHEKVDFDACLEDIKKTLEVIRESNKDIPVYLVGESMGGAIALHGAARYPTLMQGVISSVPAAERFQSKKTDVKVAMRFLKGPNKQFDIGKSIVDQATQNQAFRAAWEADPLSRMELSPKELLQFQVFMDSSSKIASDIDMPVLMLQGTLDRLVKPKGSFDLFSRIKSRDKTFLAIPSEHLILEDQNFHTPQFTARLAILVNGWLSATNAKSETAAVTPGDTTALTAPAPEPVQIKQIEMPAGTLENEMANALILLRSGKPQEARKLLEGIVQTEPLNADAHYWLALTLVQCGEHAAGKKEKELAKSLMHASAAARPRKNYIATDKTVVETVDPVALCAGKPTILVFEAAWCAECSGIDAVIKQARNNLGERAQILNYDVDSANNSSLVKSFNVGPIPTFVFLTADGKVQSTIIGRASIQNVRDKVQQILPAR